MKFNISEIQYTYCIASYKESTIHITHNHKILTGQDWSKIDQIKKNNHNRTIFNKAVCNKLETGRSVLQNILLLRREDVYDIALHEYSNFLIYKYIVHNSIEQDSDLILMLYKNSENSENNKIDVIIAKHRNGPVGSFQLIFHADICRFTDIEYTDATLRQ